MIQLSIAEACIWLGGFLVLLALNWWVSTPQARQSKHGGFPGHPEADDSDEAAMAVPTRIGLQPIWRKNEEDVIEAGRDSEFADSLFDSAR